MTQADTEIVVRKLGNIKKYLSQLQKKAKLSESDYVESFEQQLVVERLLHLLIESAVDINSHVVVGSGQPPPDTYRDSFLLLGKLGIVPTSLAQKLAPAAGLRNRLVHDYDDIDVAIVYESMKFAIELFPDYLECVQRYLENSV